MSLLAEVPLSTFKKLSSDKIRRMKSFELTIEGEYLCTVVVPPEDAGRVIWDYTKTQAEYVGHRGNTVGGKDPEEILREDSCQPTATAAESAKDSSTQDSPPTIPKKKRHVQTAEAFHNASSRLQTSPSGG